MNTSAARTALTLTFLAGTSAGAAPAIPADFLTGMATIDGLVESVEGLHDAPLNGAPDGPGGFRYGPRSNGGGGSLEGDIAGPRDWKAATAWGTVYRAEGSVPDDDRGVRVEIRSMDLWFRGRTADGSPGLWEPVQRLRSGSSLDGAWYREDFSDDSSTPADIRRTREGVSVAMAPDPGFNFHFFGADRITHDPFVEGLGNLGLGSVDELAVTVEARLVGDPGVSPAAVASTPLLLGAGADFWDSATRDGNDTAFEHHYDVGIGKHRRLTGEWQAFHMTSLSRTEALADGLLDLAGDLDRDARADADDLAPFSLAVLDAEAFERRWGEGTLLRADLNGDGRVDRGDAAGFALATGLTEREVLAVLPEPASTVALVGLGLLHARGRRSATR